LLKARSLSIARFGYGYAAPDIYRSSIDNNPGGCLPALGSLVCGCLLAEKSKRQAL